MGGVLRVFWRGFRLRCPHCGEGRVFASYLRVDDGCLECSHVYQRDPGDWTGSAEITVMLSAATALILALVARNAPLLADVPLMAIGIALWAALFPPTFRRVKGVWVALLYVWSGRCVEPELPAGERRELVKLKPNPPSP